MSAADNTRRSNTWKQCVKLSFHSLLHYSGLERIYGDLMGCRGAVILMYHSIGDGNNEKWIDPRNQISKHVFEAQLKFLQKHRNVISLDELVSCINSNDEIQRGTVVITFDDGYLDNLEVAAPLLKKYDLPATIYLATGYIDRREAQWIDKLFSSFKYRSENQLSIPELGIQSDILDSTIYEGLSAKLIPLGYKDRNEILKEVNRQLKPVSDLPRLTMSWDDVRKLIDENSQFSLGSHTIDHIDMSSLDSMIQIEREIGDSKKKILDETGIEAIHFSCPYSRASDSLPASLVNHGYKSCVLSDDSILINYSGNPFSLGRIEAPSRKGLFAHYTSGSYPGLSKKLLRGRY